jgi:release factor glutamine methyltransferase
LIALAKTKIVNTNQFIADICTGSGCIAIAMRQWFPHNPIIATDISESALATAKSSDKSNFNHNSIKFHQHDLLTQTWPFEIPHIVICNPPYINRTESDAMAPHVMLHEPHIALFVDHPDPLLFYKSLIQTFLTGAFPTIFFEMNPNYVEGLKSYCALHQLNCEINIDMQGKERFAIISK